MDAKVRKGRLRIGSMIEMQYNFPLLAEQGVQWQQRLRAAVEQLHPESAEEMRPTFRMKRLEHR